MNNPARSRNQARPLHYLLLGVTLALLAAVIWGATHVQAIRDWYILSTYSPPSEIASLAQAVTMTPYARHLFYVNQPRLEGKQAFARSCPNTTEGAYVIGCYHSGDNGIFLLSVSDPRLKGIEEVTAAYEMLHAGYARLSPNVRGQIDPLMDAYFKYHIASSAIKSQMAAYTASEPGAENDELYSVLGTEVAHLPSFLERHYQQYFTNRSQVVKMYDSYQAAFSVRLAAIEAADNQLAGLKSSIASNEQQLDGMLASINAQRQNLASLQANANYQAYNAGVPAFNSLVDSYNALVASVTNDINEYNAVVASRNSLALEEQQLVSAISTKPLKQSTK